jgi:flagellin
VAATVNTGEAFVFDLTQVGGTGTSNYVAREGDTAADVTNAVVAAIKFDLASQGLDEATNFAFAANGSTIEFTNNTGAANTIGGGLEILGKLDISTAAGAAAALAGIEGLTQTAIGAAAEFGTGEKRLEIQADFVSKLTDSLKSGIGALVDANMEEASAKLQALQVQQQLGIQSLSIANQAPQSVLSLFR